MEPVNLKKLAQELNLSVATVSRALNDRGNTSQQTKERILKLAKKLNYEPNPHASSLRRHDSKTIGVVLPEIANHFYSLVLNGIEEIARDNNYHVLIYLTHNNYEREISILRLLVSGRVDGALLSVANYNQGVAHLNLLRERNIPTVYVDRLHRSCYTAQVTTDDYDGSYTATRHLLENGCRTIVYLAASKKASSGRRHMQGYTDALQAHGIALDNRLVLQAQTTKGQDVAMIQALLHNRRDIDGVFASLESLAISSYEACRNLGLAILTDIKIIAFSHLEIASLLHPPLTTVTQPANMIGKEAARILFSAILENRSISASESLELKSELTVRASTSATR